MGYLLKSKFILFVSLFIFDISLSIAYADVLPTNNPNTIFPETANQTGSALLLPELWGTITKPYPTNVWFGNAVFYDDSAKKMSMGSFPITAYPYVLRAAKIDGDLKNHSIGLGVGYSTKRVFADTDNAWMSSEPSIINFSATEDDKNPLVFTESIVSPKNATPSLSVTLNWRTTSQTGQTIGMVAPIVRGSPYTTVFYHNATPLLKSPYVMELDGGKEGVSATRHTITINDGGFKQTWILYSQTATVFKRLNTLRALVLVTDHHVAYNGWIRAAVQDDVMNDVMDGKSVHIETGDTSDILDKSARVIPLSGQVETKAVVGNPNAEIVNFNYAVLADDINSNSPLLMTVLPHQKEILSQNNINPGLQYRTMKGPASGVVLSVQNIGSGKYSSTLSMQETLPVVSFQDTNSLTDLQVKALQTALHEDVSALNEENWSRDAYFGGKELARAGRMLVVADQINDADARKKLLTNMESYLEKYWLSSLSNNCALQYDTSFGGIIEDAVKCPDYQNYMYNDHHFHYGYFIYGLAVIAKYDPAWMKTTAGRSYTPQQWGDTLIRDYANPNNDDPYFPRLRMQDDFDGHSWAEGLWATGDGKNQESISEAVNSYYGIALYGQALNNPALENWGRFLLAREIRGAQHYWQIPKDSDVYVYKATDGTDVGFEKNHLSTAMVWNGKVHDTTFFGGDEQYRYGIIMMPFTQISKTLLQKTWIEEFYQEKLAPLIPKLGNSPQWKWTLVKGAMFGAPPQDQNQFWNQALQSNINEYDNGDSKTNTLYVMASAMTAPP